MFLNQNIDFTEEEKVEKINKKIICPNCKKENIYEVFKDRLWRCFEPTCKAIDILI
jgi:ribosomal protein L37AE/L43A